MKDFVERIEDFIFDFMGLILPGFVFILLISAPLLLFNFDSVSACQIDKFKILSILSNLSAYSDKIVQSQNGAVVFIIILLSYIIGHLIKVLSIIQYEIFITIFDKLLNRMIINCFIWTKAKLYWLLLKLIKKDSNTYNFIKLIYCESVKPIKSILIKVFAFKPPDYFSDNKIMVKESMEKLNEKLKTTFPNEWYSLFKISSVIHHQENIKSLTSIFLAKYNFYRSMAFMFFIILFYFILFFNATSTFLGPDILHIKGLIFLTIVLMWFTFHYKFKRYWTLCGNESLVSLYYYLKKNS
jgi:hypothetical protein